MCDFFVAVTGGFVVKPLMTSYAAPMTLVFDSYAVLITLISRQIQGLHAAAGGVEIEIEARIDMYQRQGRTLK
ncbi:hypothetical protein F442_12526 [Phytophthora nicotianae P10297]|uniref:Uncharacterized protein n=2 Tax=Phytophthora nicotianae TaxID=4792 RepID=W2Z1H5_PHYNI|nr:hypothetical protein F442_12526 [Phytophthora nicotianae P10297]